MSLSVVLATFNEEENLQDCLESIKDIADEIIVVDGSSKDNTVVIAKKYGARTIVTTNPQIFHINKQKAIDLASKDWILQLDADERVTRELRDEIKNVLSLDSDINGYWIPRKNMFLGRYLMKGGQYPDYTMRLYKRGKAELPQKDVHEQAEVEGKVAYLKSPLLHIADMTLKRYFLRYGRYTSLIATQIAKKEKWYNPYVVLKYVVALPVWWFLLSYIRHKGFMDSWQGFVFSFFSALRFPVAYIKSITR